MALVGPLLGPVKDHLKYTSILSIERLDLKYIHFGFEI